MTSKKSKEQNSQTQTSGAQGFHAPIYQLLVQEQVLEGSNPVCSLRLSDALKKEFGLKKTMPKYIFIENVKNLLSSNQGRDFAELLSQMAKIGYDAEWSVIDSSDVVPQHRERVYIVGHLRRERFRQVFPIQRQSKSLNRKPKINSLYHDYGWHSPVVLGTDGVSMPLIATDYKHPQKIELNKNKIKQVGNFRKTDSFGGNPQVGRVYDPEGLSPTLNSMQGGKSDA